MPSPKDSAHNASVFPPKRMVELPLWQRYVVNQDEFLTIAPHRSSSFTFWRHLGRLSAPVRVPKAKFDARLTDIDFFGMVQRVTLINSLFADRMNNDPVRGATQAQRLTI